MSNIKPQNLLTIDAVCEHNENDRNNGTKWNENKTISDYRIQTKKTTELLLAYAGT